MCGPYAFIRVNLINTGKTSILILVFLRHCCGPFLLVDFVSQMKEWEEKMFLRVFHLKHIIN